MNKKIVAIVALALVLVFAFAGCTKGDALILPSSERVNKIELDVTNVRKVDITDSHHIADIISNLERHAKPTNKDSVNDQPVNLSKYIIINIVDKDNNMTTIYLYKAGGRFYIEKPYQGIWRTDEDTYNSIAKLII